VKVEVFSDFTFEVEYRSCDTLAKEEDVSVYAERTASGGTWFFSKWRNRRTLVFRYYPERWDSPPPSITRPSKSTVLISIPGVSGVVYQNRTLANISVAYDVGKVHYPPEPK